MKIGVFADSHDHLDNVRHAVALFNREQCELVVFAGDFVSTIVTPPLRRLKCPLVACFGDNDGNKRGLVNGVSVIGLVGEPPFGFRTSDGTRIVVTHMINRVPDRGDADVIIHGHTHKPEARRDKQGRLLLNPGETSGWTFRDPTVAILETKPLAARIERLPTMPAIPDLPETAYLREREGEGEEMERTSGNTRRSRSSKAKAASND